jgi:hypothetical protein
MMQIGLQMMQSGLQMMQIGLQMMQIGLQTMEMGWPDYQQKPQKRSSWRHRQAVSA